MIFTHNNQEFRIVFMHPTEQHGKGKRKHTTQRLYHLSDLYGRSGHARRRDGLSWRAVTKYALDPFNKEEARTKALTEALVDYTDSCLSGIFDAAYLGRCQGFPHRCMEGVP